MIVLGLHFGHDASVCIIKDGKVIVNIFGERFLRIKHAMSLSAMLIRTALDEADIRIEDIDFCAVTSTQTFELIFDDPSYLKIEYKKHADDPVRSVLYDLHQQNGSTPRFIVDDVLNIVYDDELKDSWLRPLFEMILPDSANRSRDDYCAMPWINDYISTNAWNKGQTLESIRNQNIRGLLDHDDIRLGFHYPLTITLDGRSIPGYAIHHHMAHASASFYQSPFDYAAIHTHDGWGNGIGYHSGMFYLGKGNKIFPLSPNHLFLGNLYHIVGISLKLGIVGSPGKLMGLSAYGRPRFFDHRFVGNWYDLAERIKDATPEIFWWEQCINKAQNMGYDLSVLAKPEHATSPINADIAASTQKLFEETNLYAIEVLHSLLLNNSETPQNLCMSGGTALNCPTNSKVFLESPFERTFIEPCCDDSGIAIGAALCVYYNLLDNPRMVGDEGMSPYLGPIHTKDDVERSLDEAGNQINKISCDNIALDAAQALNRNEVIAWFEGRSEIGPRALGHRSILADVRYKENWSRVNKIKGREQWRPFAPIVLEEEFGSYFYGSPEITRYMLFNARVKSKDLPAISHMDFTSRIQTVHKETGIIYDVLKHYAGLTGTAVLMNTSLNGPGEPIVETPADAINFLLKSKVDALYIGNYRVTKK